MLLNIPQGPGWPHHRASPRPQSQVLSREASAGALGVGANQPGSDGYPGGFSMLLQSNAMVSVQGAAFPGDRTGKVLRPGQLPADLLTCPAVPGSTLYRLLLGTSSSFLCI